MAGNTLTVRELKKCVEAKAYAFGVSPAISVLLGEYAADLITNSKNYVRRKENQLV
jgi:hypothetical protein